MLDRVTKFHHAVVAIVVLVVPAMVLLGFAGDGFHDERFDAKQVLVVPDGADGVRIREVVDQDFGTHQRHGYERIVPNDFGVPTDVVASSPDAPDAVSVETGFDTTRIRIGDPGTTIDGQHRYVLEYTLPNAGLSAADPLLALDIIGNDETFETGRFELIVAGMTLADPTCNVGAFGAIGGCELTRDGDVYRVVFEPLAPGEGITIGGRVTSFDAPADVPVPDIPARRRSNPLPLAAGTLALGAAAAFGTMRWARVRGSNQVGGSTAADAALGAADLPSRTVTDRELAAMATTEFVPPRGLRPWHGALLLREQVDATTVSAWFSDQMAQGVIELREQGKELVAGPKLASAPPITKQRVETLLGADGVLQLGTYQARLSTLWKELEKEQAVAARESGWWLRRSPTTSGGAGALAGVLVLVLFFIGITWFAGLRHSVIATVVLAAVLPAVVALVAYSQWLPSKSVAGSAAALQTESFRRFLEASEGRHVEWAWEHGLLREYSAWAVALGAADAWGRAVANSAVPPADLMLATAPLWLHTNSGAWTSSHVKPSSAGGAGGGGFSGGSVGGGGGGGSSGSW
ncbi:MAG: DUF2207 family protein [Ilumatobacteraceae bacterium]